MSHQGEGDRGLARSRLAHQPHDLAGPLRERGLVDHAAAGAAHHHTQRLDREERRAGGGLVHVGHHSSPSCTGVITAASSTGRSTPSEARAIASVNVFKPTVRTAISPAGTMTAHGLTTSPIRFSLIIRPQFGVGGWSPKPRKLMPAMIRME